MKREVQEKGQALILVALAAIVLFAFAALAIDGSRVFSDKRHAQNAADTAALAGSLAHIRGGQTVSDTALARAQSNGYDNGASNDVTVTMTDTPPGACPGTGKDITVTIVSYVPTTFSRVIGRSQVTNAVTSTARSCDTSTGTSGPLYPGVAFMTTKTGSCSGGANPGLKSASGSRIQLWGISIGSASSDGSCIQLGSGQVQLKQEESGITCSDLQTAAANGTGINKASVSWPNRPCGTTRYGVSFPAAPANLGIVCAGDATKSGNTLSPGKYYKANFGNVDFPGGATNLNSGTYCIKTGNFTLSGSLNGNGVTIVLETGSLSWGGTGTKPDLSGPTGGPYKGLVIYSPPGNTNSMTFGTGGANERLRGTIMMQDASCDIGGQIQKNSYQFICSQLTLKSSATDVQVMYDSNALYSPPTVTEPTISLLR